VAATSSLAFGLSLANLQQLGSQGFQRLTIGLAISAAAFAAVTLWDGRRPIDAWRARHRPGSAVQRVVRGRLGVVHGTGQLAMFAGAAARYIGDRHPWSIAVVVAGATVFACAWAGALVAARPLSNS
jgi:putative intracellular protease/amidase